MQRKAVRRDLGGFALAWDGPTWETAAIKREDGMPTTYSSPKIARELTKQFGAAREPIKVEMKYTREVGQFIKKVESAQKAAANSKLVFKMG